MGDWLANLHPAVLALIRVLIWVVPILLLVPGLIWWERRLLSWMQDRIGPNRVATITWSKTSKWVPSFLRGKKTSFWGLLQPIADGVKLFFKEDISPSAVDRAIYFLAPAVALFPAFALGATLPWGPNYGFYHLLTPIADVNIGVLYLLAISSLGVYGVVLAGYASNNKYSLMGGLRSSAQLISYELAMGMSLACVVLATGSLKMTDMVAVQSTSLWGLNDTPFVKYLQNWHVFTPYGLIAMIIFLICMVAETNRAPFDLPEAENELIAGYHTEYSSMKFAVFFMGEYAAMFVFSGVLAAVFLGGYNMLPIDWRLLQHDNALGMGWLWGLLNGLNYWLAPIWFVGKIAFMISVYIWLRATLPRLRYDQLMSLGWKSLLPLAFTNFIIVATWILVMRLYGAVASLLVWVIALPVVLVLWLIIKRLSGGPTLETRTITMVDPEPRRTVALVDPNQDQGAVPAV
jgi:NADH-quinone oxidoreductase subunit H